MYCKILSIKTKDTKPVLIALYAECDGERKKYTVSEGTYREIGCPLSGEMLDEDSLEKISAEDEKRRAMQKALNILSYADNNQKALMRKLLHAGYSKDISKETVEECVRRGYIDEERQLEHLVLKLHGELLGPRKIIYKLASRSYEPKDIIKTISRLEESGDIDFQSSRRELLQRKLPQDADYMEKRKILYKYGYTK